MCKKIHNFLLNLEKYAISVYNFEDLCISESLGYGGYGEVYRGTVKEKKRALKRLYFEMHELDVFLSYLLREMKYCKEMRSKRLLRIYGISYDELNEELYVVMELLTTEDLSVYLRRNKLCREEKKEIFNSLELALRDLHELNYIHSDLKPENLCYYHDYKRGTKYIKILDYNLMSKLPKNTEVMNGSNGTYGYSAPEQFHGEICKASDIYAVGVIYLEMLCEGNMWEDCGDNYQKCRKKVLEKLEEIVEDKEYEKLSSYLRYGYKQRGQN